MKPRSFLLGASLALCLSSAAPAFAADPGYASTLYRMCDALLATQITAPGAADRGALVCPSTNPQEHPLHPRAGEAVYPFAIAFRATHAAKYRDAAILLGNWMITKQHPDGGWGEDWPKYNGWTGTTSDQLISLAGAYPILQDAMTPAEREAWQRSMTGAADFIVKTFPAGNMNYQPTGAVALRMAMQVIDHPPARWAEKAKELMALTMQSINADNFITGEGGGVDLGYNIAQSIGYIALYGILTSDTEVRHRAAELLRTHIYFVYPNGTIDNSWGTRSFKWVYESGTKTAPGVYFTFALLADQDPAFAEAGRLCLGFLTREAMEDGGLVGYGPRARVHASTEPPCLYSTFARAQSIAMAIAYGPKAVDDAGVVGDGGRRAADNRPASPRPATPSADSRPGSVSPATTDTVARDELAAAAAGSRALIPAQRTNWLRVFPTVNVAVVRTPAMMATISNYGAIGRYGRGQVSRGGSVTNLWVDGFGADGIAQASSVTVYRREEGTHMPIEQPMLPLTPRIETRVNGTWFTNLFEAEGTLTATQRADAIEVVTTGELRDAAGKSSGIGYRITHRFHGDRLTKTFEITAPVGTALAIVEPFVKHEGMQVRITTPTRATIAPEGKRTWRLELLEGAPAAQLQLAAEADRYWSPFPAVDCVPVVANVVTTAPTTRVVLEFGPE